MLRVVATFARTPRSRGRQNQGIIFNDQNPLVKPFAKPCRVDMTRACLRAVQIWSVRSAMTRNRFCCQFQELSRKIAVLPNFEHAYGLDVYPWLSYGTQFQGFDHAVASIIVLGRCRPSKVGKHTIFQGSLLASTISLLPSRLWYPTKLTDLLR